MYFHLSDVEHTFCSKSIPPLPKNGRLEINEFPSSYLLPYRYC